MSSIENAPVIGAERDRELLKDAESFIYTEPGGHELEAHFFRPKDRMGDHPVIAFFHGGMWDNGSPTQFVPQCLHFAWRGITAVTFEYRTKGRHGASPEDSIFDVQTALLSLRQNASHFGISPDQIVAAGAGSGAYNCLCAAMLPEVLTDGKVDARPNAVIAFSPIVNTTRRGIATELFANHINAKDWSPSANVRKDLPPVLMMHGMADRTSPFDLVKKFHKAMRRKKNHCDLIEFEGADHSFFNFNVSKTRYDLSMATADRFLSDIGILPPDIETDL